MAWREQERREIERRRERRSHVRCQIARFTAWFVIAEVFLGCLVWGVSQW